MVKSGDVIENPRTGQRMIFLKTGCDTNNELLQIECFSPPSAVKEPEHVHPYQESRTQMIAGTLCFMVNGREQRVNEGDEVVISPNVPHYFWNEGNQVAHYIQEFRLALHIDNFFETLFGLAKQGKLNEKGLGSPLQMAVTIPRFWNEIRVTKPPQSVQRFFFLLRPIGLLFGYR